MKSFVMNSFSLPFLSLFLYGTGNRIQGLEYARQVLYPYCQILEPLFMEKILIFMIKIKPCLLLRFNFVMFQKVVA